MEDHLAQAVLDPCELLLHLNTQLRQAPEPCIDTDWYVRVWEASLIDKRNDCLRILSVILAGVVVTQLFRLLIMVKIHMKQAHPSMPWMSGNRLRYFWTPAVSLCTHSYASRMPLQSGFHFSHQFQRSKFLQLWMQFLRSVCYNSSWIPL